MQHFRTVARSLVTAIALCVVGLPALALDLVRDGVPCAMFVVPQGLDAASAVQVSSDLSKFNDYLAQVTGTPLPTNGVGEVKIELVLHPVTNLMTRYDWRISSPDARTMRVEATVVSLFTALRQFLEEGCDARFLGVEKGLFQFEPRRTVKVSPQERRAPVHAFTLQRSVYLLPDHARELGLDSDGAFQYSHAVSRYAFPGEKYNREGWPEGIMPTLKGVKLKQPKSLYSRWQPCYSSAETAARAVTNICDYLAAHPNALSLSLGINDNGSWCGCTNCLACDAGAEKSLFSNDRQNHASSYYSYVNRVTEGVLARYPEIRFGLLAYMGTIMPPPFAVSPSVIPMLTMDSFAATLDPEVGRRQCDVIARWGRKVPVIGVWDYTWGRSSYCLPRVDFAAQAARIKYLYANGCRAYFGENGMTDMLDGPKIYLTARLLENVDADPEVILDEWYTRFAGRAAADELRGVYDACTAYWKTERMTKTPYYRGRTWLYMSGGSQCLQAMTPGFTADLVARMRKVCELAVTPGERFRAHRLFCHFALLDALVTFGGFAHVNPKSGELPNAAAAVAALEDVRVRTTALFGEWRTAQAYFGNADFSNPNIYHDRKAVETDLVTALSGLVGRVAGFCEEPSVRKALADLQATAGVPPELIRICRAVSSDAAVVIPAEELPNGGCGAFRLVRDLEPGTWLVSAKVRSPEAGARTELVVWRQKGGRDADWATAALLSLKPRKWRTLVKVNSVRMRDDGLAISICESGLPEGVHLEVAEVRLVKIADDPSACGVVTPAARLKSGSHPCVRLGGEEAVVCTDPGCYCILKPAYRLPRLNSGSCIDFAVRARLPEGAKTGRIGAKLYRRENGEWRSFKTLFWDRSLTDRYSDVTARVDAKELADVDGKVMVFVFKMRESEGVAVSNVSWRRTEKAP